MRCLGLGTGHNRAAGHGVMHTTDAQQDTGCSI